VQRVEPRLFELADPAHVDLLNGHWIQVMELLAAVFNGRDEIGSFQQGQMLAHGLPRHTHVAAEVAERAAVSIVKTVEQFSPRLVSQGFENSVCIHYADIMQPFSCMSTVSFSGFRTFLEILRTFTLTGDES
jgi:hypothetical protein